MRREYLLDLGRRWLPAGLFALIFWLVLRLYRVPSEAVLYALALCLALGLVLGVSDYRRWRQRRQSVQTLTLRRHPLPPEVLPPARDGLERDYQALVRQLWSEQQEEETRQETERRELTDYYTIWAHQIKTPIAAMRLLLQSGAAGQEEPLQGELLRVEQYVEMVLGYLRLDGGSGDLLLRNTELDAVLRQAVRRFARLFILKKLRLELRETGLRVLTDEKWLQFVVEQLLSNAIKYTPQGGTVSLYVEGEILRVEDTGIGIRAEDLPQVFEKGFTGYNGHEDKRSTGIGLYLCRRVCTQLGHGISIASTPGRGTAVSLNLARSYTLHE